MTRVLLLGLAICFGCSAPTSPPTSEQEFLDAYQSAFDNGRRQQLLGLVKWDEVPDELRTFQEKMLTSSIGEHKIRSIQLIPIQWDQITLREARSLKFNIDPQFKLFVWHQGGSYYEGQPATGCVQAFVGIENDAYYICGLVAEEKQDDTPAATPQSTIPVGVELSGLPNVSIKRSGNEERSMSLTADGALRCRGSLVEILRFVYPAARPRFRNDALPTGVYSVSLPGDLSVSDDHVGVTPEVQSQAWRNLVKAYEDAFDVLVSSVSREEDTYRLVVKENGAPKLEQAPSSDSRVYGTGGFGLRFSAYSMDALAEWLERDRAVFNATEMNGQYNFELPLDPSSDGIDVDVHKVIASLRTIELDLRSGRDRVNVILIQKKPNKARP